MTGRWGDIDGVWIEPVIAQEMMIFDIPAPLQAPLASAGATLAANRSSARPSIAMISST